MGTYTTITKRNWGRFEHMEDAVTLEKYKIGDKVTKCSKCKQVFHWGLVDGTGKCPYCEELFVAMEIITKTITLGNGKSRQRSAQRPVFAPRSRRIHLSKQYKMLRILSWISILTAVTMLLLCGPGEKIQTILRNWEWRKSIWDQQLNQMIWQPWGARWVRLGEVLSYYFARAGSIWQTVWNALMFVVRKAAENFGSIF